MFKTKQFITMIVITLTISTNTLFARSVDDAINSNLTGIIAMNLKMSLIAENIANMNTLKDEETGLPWQKRILSLTPSKEGVRVDGILKSNEPFTKYFDPAVSQSDEYGYTYHPNVNLPNEMVNLKYTEAVLESNVNAFKVSKAMYQTAIDFLK